VLLLGDQGVGKTSLLVDLVAAGHSYLGDDQLFLSSDGQMTPLQGLLELRIDLLASHPELGGLAKSTGWRQARALRSVLRGAGTIAVHLPTRLGRRTARALRRMDDSLSDHCFFVDPRQAFSVDRPCVQALPTRVYLLSQGTPDLVEPATPEMIERWLLEEVMIAYRDLFELMTAAARVSPRWRSALDEALAAQRSVVAGAAGQLTATRVRAEPAGAVARFARVITAADAGHPA